MKGESDKAATVTAEADRALASACGGRTRPGRSGSGRGCTQRPHPSRRHAPLRLRHAAGGSARRGLRRWTSRSTSPRPRPPRRKTSARVRRDGRGPGRGAAAGVRRRRPLAGRRRDRLASSRRRSRSPLSRRLSTWKRSPGAAAAARPGRPPRAARAALAAAAVGRHPIDSVPADLRRAIDEIDQYSLDGLRRGRAPACSPRWGRGCPPIPPSFSGSPSSASSSRRRPRWDELLEPGARARRGGRAAGRTSRCSSARASSSSRRRTSLPSAPAPAARRRRRRLRPRLRRLGGLFGAQSAVAEEPAPASGGTDLGDASLSDIFREFQKGARQAARQGGLRDALQPRHRLQGDGPRRRGDRRDSSWPRRTSAGCSSVRACSGCASSRRACPSWP